MNGESLPTSHPCYKRVMAGQLAGKVVLITGAASGIGAGTVERLCAEGATVIAADVNAEGLAAVAASTGADTVLLDVGSAMAWHAVLADVVDRHGRIDIAFLNAGIMTRRPGENLFGDVAECLTEEGYRRIMSVNIDGAALGVIALLPYLERQGGGDILITASVAGLVPFPDDPFYGLSKHAMVGFGRALAPALAGRNIRVNVLCPGATDTGILAPDQRASRDIWAPPAYIADAVVTILNGGGSGEVWVAYRVGHKPWRYEFAPSRERVIASEAVPILVAGNVADALARYATLGFDVAAFGDEANPEYGFLTFGAAHLHIARVDNVDPRQSNVAAYVYVADADGVHAAWSASEVEGRFVAPVDTEYGLREGAYVDPDGNLIRYGSPLD